MVLFCIVAGKLGRRVVKTHGSSRFVGVHWDTPVGRWTATITLPGPPPRAVRIARFDREEDAAVAWDRVTIHLRGLTAPRNFPARLLAPASIEEIRREARRLRKLRTESRWIGVQRASSAKLGYSYSRPWVSELRLPSGRLVSVAGYATDEEAALARDRLVLFYRGESEELNFRAEALRLGPADAKTLQADRERVRKATTSSRYRGVSWAKASGCWRALIGIDDRSVHLGLFADEEEAARAHDKHARRHHGARAKVNFPRPPSRRAP